tara:strand:- start:9209 stop:10081 length:873 start_codon:yes stop_codon:yes gene_type:complete
MSGPLTGLLRVLPMLGMLLVACQSTTDYSSVYIGWQCDTGRGSNINCQQRAMRNGQPVDQMVVPGEKANSDVPDGATVEPMLGAGTGAGTGATVAGVVDVDAPVTGQPLEIIWVGDNRPKTWRKYLPALTLDQPEVTSTPANVSAPGHRESSERPEPEPFANWTRDSGSGGTHDAQSASVVVDQSVTDRQGGERGVRVALPTSPGSTGSSKTGYTVQLGAFKNADTAQRFLRDKGLLHLAVNSWEYENNGQHWHLLTYGHYVDRQSAREAWTVAADNASEIDVWIRPIKR